jgi:hypothetical protein
MPRHALEEPGVEPSALGAAEGGIRWLFLSMGRCLERRLSILERW